MRPGTGIADRVGVLLDGRHPARLLLALALVTPASTLPAATVTSCDEASLRAAINGGGLVTFACDGTITLSSTLVIATQTVLDAGAHNITISGNDAVRVFYVNPGVSLVLSNLTIAGGSSGTEPRKGSGLFNDGGNVLIAGCTFIGNKAISVFYSGSGGAIYNASGALSVSGSTFAGNAAYGHAGTGNLGRGGAIFVEAGQVSLVNCTFFRNSARTHTANFRRLGSYGGAVFNDQGQLGITNCTFVENRAIGEDYSFGGNVWSERSATLVNTILANSPSGGNGGTNLIDGGHNLSSDNSCGFSALGSLNNVDLKLGPLASKGGPTMTIMPLSGSPAIDAADNTRCPSQDQRGFIRPVNGTCDIGAVEVPAGVLRFSSSTYKGWEAVGSATITVERRDYTQGTVSVDFRTGGGNATAGLDYIATNGTLAFRPGELCKSFEVPILSDSVTEISESISLLLSNPFGGEFGSPSSASLTIFDDEPPTNLCSEAGLAAALSIGGSFQFDCDATIILASPLVAAKDAVLDARGHRVTISGNNSVRVLEVCSGIDLTLLNITIADGRSTEGGGVYNNGGRVTMIDCTLTNNHAIGQPGTSGTNGLSAVVFKDGEDGTHGYPGQAARGGAFFNAGALLITNTTLVGNSAEGGTGGSGGAGGRGAGFRDQFGRCVSETRGGDGGAGAPGGEASGGALFNIGTAVLEAVTVRNNRVSGGASGGGGSIGPSGCGGYYTVHPGSSAVGGASQGGGIFNQGLLRLSAVSLFANTAQGGTGGKGADRAQGTYETAGAAGGLSFGAGIANLGTNTMVNVTLALNRSIGGDGGLGGLERGCPAASSGSGGDGFAAGLFNSGSFSATNCTIWVNESVGGFATNLPAGCPFRLDGPRGTGFAASIQNTGGVVMLVNSIVGNPASASNCLGAITGLGNNICSDASAAFTSPESLNSTDPRLGPLADNGGATRTIGLEPGSPAIDAADNAQCPPTDQRGVSRPVGVACDIGAFEGTDGVLYPNLVQSFTPSRIVGGSPSTLQFSLGNVSSRTLSNITFTNRLPPQVTVAANPNVRSDCSGTVLATGGTISVFGMDLLPHQVCSIQVDVTSLLSGIYSNLVGPVFSTEAGEAPASGVSILVVETPPSAITGMPSGRTGSSAILNGLVNPNGLNTTAHFEFGLTTNYGSQTPVQALGNGRGFVAVSNMIADLAPATGHHFRLVASSPLGTSFGKDQFLLTVGLTPETLVNLDGVDDYVTTPNLRNFFTNETVTIEVWFRAKSRGVIVQDKGQPPPGNGNWYYWAIEILASGEVMIRVGGIQSAISLGRADFDSWHHVVLRYDKESLNLDGFLDGAEAITDARGDRDAPWEVGHGQYYVFGMGDWPFMPFVGFFRGDLGEVRIWNVARTAEEIRTNLSRRLSGSEPGLVCYWRLDEGGGTIAHDASGHGNTGTAANGVRWAPGFPVARTGPATQVTSVSAVLSGVANANQSDTAAWFEFGLTTNYGARTFVRSIGVGGADVSFSGQAAELLPTTLYHYRAAATNRFGTNYGSDSFFFSMAPAPGVSVALDGVNDSIWTPDLRSFFSNETVTVELWFNPQSAGIIVDEQGANPGTASWHDSQAEILPSGEVRVRVYDLTPLSLGTITFGNWHHAALRYDKAMSRLDGFLDGVISAQATSGDRSAPWESGFGQIYAFGLGDPANLGSGAYFRGQLDEIRIWNTARTAAQIATNMFRRLTGTEPGLVCYWRLDDGAGLTANDSSGRGNAGTLYNGVSWGIGPSPIGSLLGLRPILGIRQRPDGRVQLDSTGLDGTSYVLQASSNLEFWFAVATNRASAGGALQFIDAGPLGSPQRFYRLAAP